MKRDMQTGLMAGAMAASLAALIAAATMHFAAAMVLLAMATTFLVIVGLLEC